MKYSVCIDAVFKGVDSLEALDRVKAAGFEAFEFWNWAGRDLAALRAKADSLGLQCVTFVGKKANLTDPKERDAWISGMKEAAGVAKMMGTGCLIATAGEDTGAVRNFQRRSIVNTLKAALPVLTENNITLLLEPLNGRVDHTGTYLESSDEAFAILDEVGSRHVKLLFDIYHQQITEGDIIRRMKSRISDIGHIHSAGSPGRHELDTGELNYRKIFDILDEAGYEGYAGLEYFPQGDLSPGDASAGDSLTGLKRMYDYLHR
ncbi:MAG: TIM barrel protein [Treponema sp.]|nr:TIM barrel protein [Treponema sp.]